MLYQRHLGKGTIVSLYCCFSGHQEGTKHHISLEAHKKNENRPSAKQFPKTSLAFCDRMNTARAYASSGKFSLTNCQ